MKAKVACIVGNGPSRKTIDTQVLQERADITTIGCNAIYRDHPNIDYVVAIDDGMIKECQEGIGERSTLVIPPVDQRYESALYNTTRRRSNAGMNAMSLAIEQGHDLLYCIGFDFMIEDTDPGSNVYAGTSNYSAATRTNASDVTNRLNYFDWYCAQNPGVTFIMVVPDECKPKRLRAMNVVAMRSSVFNSKSEEK